MLENVSYCPLLHSRVAEMKALLQLPAASKDRLLPVFLARPWQNAKFLSTTWQKIVEALGSRRFGLDLDRTRYQYSSEKPAQDEFNRLFLPHNGFENYFLQVRDIPQAIPVLRNENGQFSHLSYQAKHVNLLERNVIARVEYGYTVNPILAVNEILNLFDDAVIFVDTGWSTDILGRELWASNIIQTISDLKPDLEIVLSGSSFPDEFKHIALRGENIVKERFLYSNLVKKHNSANIVYGDWGSTRPSLEPAPMTIIPRIDLPTSGEWISFRQDKEKNESYLDIAKRVLADKVWPKDLNIWGTYTISSTATDLPGAIKSPSTAAAARINIHLHKQAHFGSSENVNDQDEPYTDD